MNTMNPKLRRTRTEVHDDLTAPGAPVITDEDRTITEVLDLSERCPL